MFLVPVVEMQNIALPITWKEKHNSVNSDFSSYLQNLDGNIVEYSFFHKERNFFIFSLKILYKSWLLLVAIGALLMSVGISIHS